ncbi:Os08g0172250 [Oryza sativa Japonica Group]|uniref:Os08g0172250 protein n=1 Tax=Oryza sativa subsp. japonica TaxID=39947 RepID=A0A0P0XCS3_ORYSJ|nr:Os08g0172250 [Oryza sativa Japonica Group]
MMRWMQEDAGRGDEIRGRGRGRMGWIRMLTGERMQREQENGGATSAGRMAGEGGGRGDGTDWGGRRRCRERCWCGKAWRGMDAGSTTRRRR